MDTARVLSWPDPLDATVIRAGLDRIVQTVMFSSYFRCMLFYLHTFTDMQESVHETAIS